MGAWTLGRDAALLQREASIPPTRAAVAHADPRSEAEKAGEPAPQEAKETLADMAGKLLTWIPGEVIALYGALLTIAMQNNPEKLGSDLSIALTVLGVIVAGGFVLLAAYSNTTDESWQSKRIKWRAGLASVAFAIWSLTVPNSGWNEINWIAENPGLVAGIAGFLGIAFSFFATGKDNRLAKEVG